MSTTSRTPTPAGTGAARNPTIHAATVANMTRATSCSSPRARAIATDDAPSSSQVGTEHATRRSMPGQGSGRMPNRPRLSRRPRPSTRRNSAGCTATTATGTSVMSTQPQVAAAGASTPHTSAAAAHVQPYAIRVVA
jgi:hypothetical protein